MPKKSNSKRLRQKNWRRRGTGGSKACPCLGENPICFRCNGSGRYFPKFKQTVTVQSPHSMSPIPDAKSDSDNKKGHCPLCKKEVISIRNHLELNACPVKIRERSEQLAIAARREQDRRRSEMTQFANNLPIVKTGKSSSLADAKKRRPKNELCPICNHRFRGVEGLASHVRNMHFCHAPAVLRKLEIELEANGYSLCSLCWKTTPLGFLEKHLKRFH